MEIEQRIIEKIISFYKNFLYEIQNSETIEICLLDIEQSSYFDYIKGCFLINTEDNLVFNKLHLKKNLTRITHIISCLTLIIKRIQQNSYLSSYNSNEVYITKREIYYSNVQLFQNMTTIDRVLSDLCGIFYESRFSFNIFPSSKGLLYCPVILINSNKIAINILSSINLISSDMIIYPFTIDWNSSPYDDIEFILIVEKETVFQNIINSQIFLQNFGCSIVITGKGYPDYITRRFINLLKTEINKRKIFLGKEQIKLLYFGDWDIYGIDIYMIYSFGNRLSSLENNTIAISGISWVGLLRNQLHESHLFDIESNNKNSFFENENVMDDIEDLNKCKTKDELKIQSLMNHPSMDTVKWKQILNDICYNFTSLQVNIVERICLNDLIITIDSIEVLKNEIQIINQSNKRAEAEAIIQKDFILFLQLINERINYLSKFNH